MKIFRGFLSIVAIFLIAYNTSLVDFENLFEGDSLIAIICILALLCAVLLLLILEISVQIKRKKNQGY